MTEDKDLGNTFNKLFSNVLKCLGLLPTSAGQMCYSSVNTYSSNHLKIIPKLWKLRKTFLEKINLCFDFLLKGCVNQHFPLVIIENWKECLDNCNPNCALMTDLSIVAILT